tara:strand:- start:4457 stop:4735 length:279 start_codon:yes stop_codon:yes gene_type:complete
MRDIPVDDNYYEKILNNFEQFCDQFEGAAARRFSGVDNDSRQPIEHEAVEHITPTVVREVDVVGEEDVIARKTTVDVPSTTVNDIRDGIGDT